MWTWHSSRTGLLKWSGLLGFGILSPESYFCVEIERLIWEKLLMTLKTSVRISFLSVPFIKAVNSICRKGLNKSAVSCLKCTLFEMIHCVEEHLVQSVLVHSNFIQGCVRLQRKYCKMYIKKEISKQKQNKKPPCGRYLHYLADCFSCTFQMLSDGGNTVSLKFIWNLWVSYQ